MIRGSLVVLFLCVCMIGFGQSRDWDALIHKSENHSSQDSQLYFLIELIWSKYRQEGLEKQYAQIPKMLEIADKTEDIQLKFKAKTDVAYILDDYGEVGRAREVLFSVMHLEDQVTYPYVLMEAYQLAGSLCDIVDADSAMVYYNKALEIANDFNSPELIGAVYNNMANFYRMNNHKQKALTLYNKALGFFISIQDSLYMANAYNNISYVHPDYDTSRLFLLRAKNLYKGLHHVGDENDINYSLARLEYDHGNYKASIKYFKTWLDHYQFDDVQHETFTGYVFLGHNYLDLNQLDSASYFYLKAKNFAENSEGLEHSTIRELYRGLENLYIKKGDYTRAHEYLNNRFAMFTEREYSASNESANEFYVKYETAEKERQLAEQALVIEQEKNKRNRQLLISLGLLGLGGILGLYYFNRLKRRRRETQHQLQLKQVEAQALKEVDEMKSRWFENISHDIRTPLTLITAPIKDVLKSTTSPSTINLLQIADRNSQHLLQLTNEMLELARLENNIIPLHEQTKYVQLECEKIIHAFDSFATEQGIEIHSKIDLQGDLALKLDYDKYEKVFNNIFKNAIQYSPVGSTVEVTIHFDKTQLITKITDQGAGIPQEEIPHLFNKYFRATHHQSRMIEGSGLGLSIVKELIDPMNGTVDVQSDPGQGSTFTFKLPAVIESMDHLTEGMNEEVSSVVMPASYNESVILLVEDNAEMRNYLSTMLSAHYQIQAASHAQAALQLLDTQTFDLIISDIMMPGMDGFDFRRRVNSMTEHAQTPFVFLSAKALNEDKIEGLRLGVDDYITKPFITEELLVRINNLLHRKSVRMQSEDVETSEENLEERIDSFIDQTRAIILNEIQNPNFGVDILAEKLHYSPRQLNRLLKKESGLTTVQFILEVRLLRARQLLLSNTIYSAKEVQHQVGIQSQSYFSRKYAERFGMPPGQVALH